MASTSQNTERLHDSEVFHILGNDRRRAIVQLLADRSEVEVSEVATEIADDEADAGTVPSNLYKSVYVSLQQTHLPQLEEDGVVVYDSEAKLIRPGPNFDVVRTYVSGDGGEHKKLLSGHVILAIGTLVVVAGAGIVDAVSYSDLVLLSVAVYVVIAASGLYALAS